MSMCGNTIGAVCLVEGSGWRELSFEEILLDETLVQGHIWILKDALQCVGGVNYRLGAKRDYELLIRIAKEYTVLQLGQESSDEIKKELEIEWLDGEKFENFVQTMDCCPKEELKTDCYLIGRYKSELMEMGCFNDAVLGVAEAGGEEILKYLEGMISGSDEFYHIYDCTQPILIYVGSDICYNILDTFSRCVGRALMQMGNSVEYFNIGAQEIEDLAGYTKRRFKAVIGMQTYMFSVRWNEHWKEGGFAHDEIAAPKYHFVFDHPIQLMNHLLRVPRHMCVMTPDRNYAKFIQNYYGHPARFLPPGGEMPTGQSFETTYDMIFLGSYHEGPIESMRIIRNADRKRSYLVNRYILYMRQNLKMTPEDALKKALDYYRIPYTIESFLEIMHRERWVIHSLAYYYKNRVITTLLKEGISIHVFGDTWKQSPMWGHPLLIWHEAVMGEEALEVYAKAKLSLNIMTWHKDGFTERIANSMLQKSVVVTDRTTYLEENFENGRELLMFDLGHLEELPGQIKELLSDEEKRAQIAECAYQKALKYHTWDARAKTLLQWIEEDIF